MGDTRDEAIGVLRDTIQQMEKTASQLDELMQTGVSEEERRQLLMKCRVIRARIERLRIQLERLELQGPNNQG